MNSTNQSSAQESEILVEQIQQVCWITLNRPAKRNALRRVNDPLIWRAIGDAVRNDSCACIVISGAGSVFCSGSDLSEPRPLSDLNDAYSDEEVLNRFRFAPLIRSEKPVIAALNGPAIGAGSILALYCDLRVAMPRASLSVNFARLALPAEYGIAWHLTHLVGKARAADLLLSGRTVEATEAQSIGLISKVFDEEDFRERVVEYGTSMFGKSYPSATGSIKKQLLDSATQSFREAVVSAEALVEKAIASPQHKAVISRLLKR